MGVLATCPAGFAKPGYFSTTYLHPHHFPFFGHQPSWKVMRLGPFKGLGETRLLHTQLGNLCVWKFKVPSHPHLERLGSHIANLEIGWWRRGCWRWQVVVVTGRRPTAQRRSLLIWLPLSYPSIQVSLNVTSSDKSSLSSYSKSSFLL